MSGRLVKICGLTRPDDIDACARFGASAIGLNLTRGSPRRLAVGRAAELAEHAGSRLSLVWIVDGAPPLELEALCRRFPASRVQRCDPAWTWPETLASERRIEVVRLATEQDLIQSFERPEPLLVCDAPGALGGSGRLSNWSLARKLAERRPVLLAGGLTADNVAQAIESVRPQGVDVAGGVEVEPGIKDHDKLRAFIAAARSGAS